MKRALARWRWLRLALALAVIYVFAGQGIAFAMARGAQPGPTAHGALCEPLPGSEGERGKPVSHQDCCLAGCRHSGEAGQASLAPADPAIIVPAPPHRLVAPALHSAFLVVHPSRDRPPVRGPPPA